MAREPKAAKPQTEEAARPAEQTETATAPPAPEIKPVEAPAASRAFNRPWGSEPRSIDLKTGRALPPKPAA
jgi:hypothetical protein